MGRIFVGMGFSMAPGKPLTTGVTEDTGDFLVFFGDAAAAVKPAMALLPDALFFLLFSVPPVVNTFRFLSARATASASHAAFNFPRVAGRLLVHSAEPLSPAISAMVRLVSTEVLYWSISNPGTTCSSFFLIRSHSFPLLPGRPPFMRTSAKSPFSRLPFRRNFRSPFASMAAASFSVPGTYSPLTGTGDRGCHVPTSQTITVPPP